jgi:hypothetical protein
MPSLEQRLNEELSALETMLIELISSLEKKDSYDSLEVQALVLCTRLAYGTSSSRLQAELLTQAMEASPSIRESEQEKS